MPVKLTPPGTAPCFSHVSFFPLGNGFSAYFPQRENFLSPALFFIFRSFDRSNTPLLGGRHPLSRTSSLIDSIGIQRAASPFSSMKEPFIPQSSGVMSSSFWHGDHPESRVSTPVQQHPLLQRNESSSSFSYAANLGVNLSTHSLAVDITPLGTPTAAQSHVNLFPSSDIPPNMSMNGMSQLPAPVSVESSWRYIDTQGQIHGPFTTQMMSQWYIGGYFASTLQISRLGSTPETLGINDIFITLGELMTKLEKYETDRSKFHRRAEKTMGKGSEFFQTSKVRTLCIYYHIFLDYGDF